MTKYLNLEFIVLGPPTLAADEASAVVNSAVLDHLLRLEDHAPATRTPVLNPAVGQALITILCHRFSIIAILMQAAINLNCERKSRESRKKH